MIMLFEACLPCAMLWVLAHEATRSVCFWISCAVGDPVLQERDHLTSVKTTAPAVRHICAIRCWSDDTPTKVTWAAQWEGPSQPTQTCCCWELLWIKKNRRHRLRSSSRAAPPSLSGRTCHPRFGLLRAGGDVRRADQRPRRCRRRDHRPALYLPAPHCTWLTTPRCRPSPWISRLLKFWGFCWRRWTRGSRWSATPRSWRSRTAPLASCTWSASFLFPLPCLNFLSDFAWSLPVI